MSKNPKKIALFIESSRKSGRGLLRGIARHANTSSKWVFYSPDPFYISPLKTDPNNIKTYLNKWKVDAIITREPAKVEFFIKKKIPVIIAISCSGYPKTPKVISDCNAIGKMAAEHFLHRGFTKFAFCGYESLYWSDLRKKHFCSWVEKSGYNTYVYQKPRSKSMPWEKEIILLSNWLKSLPKPIGVFTCNDDRGSQVIEACKNADINIPHDVAVLGVDDDDLACDLIRPSLSSISLDFEQTGFEAARLLDKMLKRKNAKTKDIILKPTHITMRQSTNILAIDDIAVSNAIEFIIENKKDIISVEQVAQSVALSRRTLERRFQNVLGTSVLQEIKRIRINEISQMLIDTNLSIKQIASVMGFESAKHISRYFKSEKGLSPTDFRLSHKIK